MTSLNTLRDGLKTRLGTISLPAPLQFSAHDVWPDVINPPCALVKPTGTDPQQTFGGNLCRYDFEMNIVVGLAGGLANAQETMDPLISSTGASSVYTVIHGDRTLGGVATWANVHGLKFYDSADVGNIEALVAKMDVEVWST